MANLDRFIECRTDDERLALGLDVLTDAMEEASVARLIGWEQRIYEYVVALRDGKGLNRPL